MIKANNFLKKRYGVALALLLSSEFSYAGCVQEVHFNPQQCIPERVASIAGSNGDQKLIEIQQNMATTSANLQLALTQTMTDLMTVVSQGTAKIISSSTEVSKTLLEQEALILKAQKDTELTYLAELAAAEIKSERAYLFPDDSAEETQVIIEALNKLDEDGNVLVLSQALKEEWDEQPEKQIPVALEMSKGTCDEGTLEDGKCSKFVSITPGLKLEAYFAECNRAKGMAETIKRAFVARDIAMQESSKSVNEAAANTNSSTAIATALKDQKERNCTVEMKKNGLCGNDIEPEEMQVLYRQCVINENGNVSASNLVNPASVCSLSTSSVSKETYETLVHESLDHTDIENNPEQDQNAAPVVYSYKNTNQLRSALDYADNLIAMNLVPNQLPKDRNDANAMEYQSRYKSRLARLSLAHQAVMDSVSVRIGKKLADQKVDDPNYESADPLAPVKESSLGGGALDLLYKEVNSAFEKLDFSKDGANKEAVHGQAAEGYWEKELLRQVSLQNKLLYKQILEKEKEIMIKAALLSSEINSPNNILYMKKIRNGE